MKKEIIKWYNFTEKLPPFRGVFLITLKLKNRYETTLYYFVPEEKIYKNYISWAEMPKGLTKLEEIK